MNFKNYYINGRGYMKWNTFMYKLHLLFHIHKWGYYDFSSNVKARECIKCKKIQYKVPNIKIYMDIQ